MKSGKGILDGVNGVEKRMLNVFELRRLTVTTQYVTPSGLRYSFDYAFFYNNVIPPGFFLSLSRTGLIDDIVWMLCNNMKSAEYST